MCGILGRTGESASVSPRPLAEYRRLWKAAGPTGGLAGSGRGLAGNFAAGGAGAAGVAGTAAAAGDAEGSGVDEDCVGSGAASAPLPSVPSARAFTEERGGRWGRSRPRTSRAMLVGPETEAMWSMSSRIVLTSPIRSLLCR